MTATDPPTPAPDERFAAALDELIRVNSYWEHHDKRPAARADVIALYEAKVRECKELWDSLADAMNKGAALVARAEAAERDAERWLTFVAMSVMYYPEKERGDSIRKIVAAIDAELRKDPFLRSLRETIRAAMAAGGR